jgi:UDP-N-acetylenolpyruvoylglucosamine reductase
MPTTGAPHALKNRLEIVQAQCRANEEKEVLKMLLLTVEQKRESFVQQTDEFDEAATTPLHNKASKGATGQALCQMQVERLMKGLQCVLGIAGCYGTRYFDF